MPAEQIDTDVLIIGASASGLMCAIEAGKRGRRVTVVDHANRAGKKILMSGGGRCNFTNMDISADNFISHNRHFCKSALSRYTQWNFIAMVNAHHIRYHERDLGKLFCDDSAKDILNMLLAECKKVKVDIQLNSEVSAVDKKAGRYFISTSQKSYQATSLVVASGGLSIPKMCASPIGYKIAEQFGHHIWPTSPGLVPFTLQPDDKEKLEVLAGVSVESSVSNQRISFDRENILFTHRGLSGPAILQISSYWQAGEAISIDLLPSADIEDKLLGCQQKQPNTRLKTILSQHLPKRLLPIIFEQSLIDSPLQELSRAKISEIAQKIHQWQIKPNGTEGYRTAEVTLGGIDCDEISSKTMESSKSSGLYFIGEVLDVTGWLGGYNFQWAWSSGWCAGQVV
jgi:predicted Rossmann fold flavoprotein